MFFCCNNNLITFLSKLKSAMLKNIFLISLLFIIPLQSKVITPILSWCKYLREQEDEYDFYLQLTRKNIPKIGCTLEMQDFIGFPNPFTFESPSSRYNMTFWLDLKTQELLAVTWPGSVKLTKDDDILRSLLSTATGADLKTTDYTVSLFRHENLYLNGIYFQAKEASHVDRIALLMSSNPAVEDKIYTVEEFLELYNPSYLDYHRKTRGILEL